MVAVQPGDCVELANDEDQAHKTWIAKVLKVLRKGSTVPEDHPAYAAHAASCPGETVSPWGCGSILMHLAAGAG